MKFIKLYEDWRDYNYSINESISTARTRFLETELVTEDEFEEAMTFDVSKNKKYIEKILDLYIKGKDEDDESIQRIGSMIKRFDSLVNRNKISNSDINYYKSFKSLKSAVEDAEIGEVEQEATDLKSGDFMVLKDTKDLLIVIPQTHEASKEWGYDTNWCTTSSSDSYWNDYTLNRDINLFYIMVKNKSLLQDWYEEEHGELPDENSIDLYSKMAVAVYPYGDDFECFDKKDNSIDFEVVERITGLGEDFFEWQENEKPGWWYDIRELDLDPKDVRELEDGTIKYEGDVYIGRYVDLSSDGYLGYFSEITGDLHYENQRNYDVTSMQDCSLPREVGYDFTFINTNIKDLVGCPEIIGHDCDIRDNVELISIEGAPKQVGGDFIYKNTPLSNSRNSMIRMTADDIRKHIKVEGLIINDYGEWGEGESDTKRFYHPSQISMFNDDGTELE